MKPFRSHGARSTRSPATLYLRPGELYELRWKDVDLDAELVTVTRAWDWAAREVKGPKSRNGVRDVPIPPALLPLLTRMREGQPLDAKVLATMESTGENKGAALLRVHLELAGVTHPRLTEDTATRLPVGFRSWRDTGITWAAIDGVDVHKLQRRAGHDDIATTAAYVKEAEDRGKLRGRVFPALPNRLVWPNDWPRNEAARPEKKASRVPEEGVEAAVQRGERTRNAASAREHAPSETSNRSGPPQPTSDPDDALKNAIVAAVHGGLFDRARALLDVLANTSAPAAVIDLRERRR